MGCFELPLYVFSSVFGQEKVRCLPLIWQQTFSILAQRCVEVVLELHGR